MAIFFFYCTALDSAHLFCQIGCPHMQCADCVACFSSLSQLGCAVNNALALHPLCKTITNMYLFYTFGLSFSFFIIINSGWMKTTWFSPPIWLKSLWPLRSRWTTRAQQASGSASRGTGPRRTTPIWASLWNPLLMEELLARQVTRPLEP